MSGALEVNISGREGQEIGLEEGEDEQKPWRTPPEGLKLG